MEVFTQIRTVLNMILPMINLIPFLDPNIKKQVSDLQTKLNAIPTVEDMIAA